MASPIITTLLDTDVYKYTMANFIRTYYPKAKATFEFTNRNKMIRMSKLVDMGELREQLDHVRSLTLSHDERDVIHKQTGIMQDEFQLPEYDMWYDSDEQIHLSFEGLWHEATMWETFAMSIVSELFQRKQDSMGTAALSARDRLNTKITVLRALPHIKVIDFGTRRRFSREWHAEVLSRLTRECPENLVGTSNLWLANAHNLPAIGTMAHELFMGVAAMYDHAVSSLRGSQQIVLRQWWDLYGKQLSIALTDTWGADFFFKDFTVAQGHAWRGLRQDSGDPIVFARKAQEWYRSRAVAPGTLVFSDGLDIQKIILLETLFGKTFNCRFGWGTDLVNDTGNVAPPVVVKLVELNRRPTCKLSDTHDKNMGHAEVQRVYKEAFAA